MREEASLDEKVQPYSIRHGMAREMRKRKVPSELISLFLGYGFRCHNVNLRALRAGLLR